MASQATGCSLSSDEPRGLLEATNTADWNTIVRFLHGVPESDARHRHDSLITLESKPRFTIPTSQSPPSWHKTNASCASFSSRDTPEYLCPTCRRIDTENFPEYDAAEHDTASDQAIHLGTLHEIFREAATCSCCRLIMYAVWIKWTRDLCLNEGHYSEHPAINLFRTQLHDRYYLYPYKFRSHNWNPLLRVSKTPHISKRPDPRSSLSDDHEEDMMFRSFKGRSPGYGRVISPELMDYDWIKGRLALCDERTTTVTYHHTVSIRVIDVERMCLTTLQTNDRYVILSYVWGTAKTFKLVRATELELRQEDSLKRLYDKLPRTFQDAIEMVRKINERYLWIDALCILQDDDQDKSTQIPYMGKIYQGAVLTIAACYGKDVNSGIPGVRSGTRRAFQAVCRVGHLTFGTRLTESLDGDFGSLWGTRAWTLQESLLSRRMLKISEHSMSWWCAHTGCYEDENCRHEDVPAGTGSCPDWWIFFTIPKTASMARVKQYCSLDAYACIVSDYTQRNISFSADAENAMMGILVHLRPHFLGSFIHGLPDVEMINALMWVPIGRSIRRIGEKGKPLFPSWSWLGWTGHAAYPWVLERQFPSSDAVPPLLFSNATEGKAGECWFSGSEYRMPSFGPFPEEQESWKRSKTDPWCFTNPHFETAHPNPVPRMPINRPFNYLRADSWSLRFRTISAHFELGSKCHHRAHNYDCDHSILQQRVLDRNGICTGYIYSPMRHTQNDTIPLYSGKHEFLVLSRASLCSDPTIGAEFLQVTERVDMLRQLLEFGSNAALQKDHLSFGGDGSANHIDDMAYFDRRVYCNAQPWCLYNVMMVTRDKEEVERLAVGRIHIGAFLTADSQEKVCSLS